MTPADHVDLLPQIEAARLAAVRRYDILDTPPDGSFDRITAIAARIFGVPISIVSLVDNDRIWFKSHHGLDVRQIDRQPGLCASAILQDKPYLLTDAKTDPRSLANPLVAGEFGLRFYLGVPLETHDKFNLGTLCVIDRQPRTVTAEQIASLRDLARVVMDEMELRLAARRAVGALQHAVQEKDEALHRAELLAREIDHRVMNSLQMVSSFLHLQGKGIKAPEVKEQFEIAGGRVAAIAQVHRHIYAERSGGDDLPSYLQRLCEELGKVLRATDRQIEVKGDALVVPATNLVPLGLIVSELVTNAVKHGAGSILVCLEQRDDGRYDLSVSDNGPGLGDDFDPEKSTGLGMTVIGAMVRQIGGRLSAGKPTDLGGAKFKVTFLPGAA